MIEKEFKAFLWSYNSDNLDQYKHKKIIIENILNMGDKKSTDRLFQVYSKKDISDVLKNMKESVFNKKSVNHWRKILK